MQHSTSWLNCSNGYRREVLSLTRQRGPTEAEARAAKAQRAEERRRAKATELFEAYGGTRENMPVLTISGAERRHAKAVGKTYDPREVVVSVNGQMITGFAPDSEIRID